MFFIYIFMNETELDLYIDNLEYLDNRDHIAHLGSMTQSEWEAEMWPEEFIEPPTPPMYFYGDCT